jgi:hypothetical protein
MTKSIVTRTAHTPRTTSSHMCCQRFHNQDVLSRTLSSFVYSLSITMYLGLRPRLFFHNQDVLSRTMSSFVYSLSITMYLGLRPRLFFHNHDVITRTTSSVDVYVMTA